MLCCWIHFKTSRNLDEVVTHYNIALTLHIGNVKTVVSGKSPITDQSLITEL